MAKSSMKLTPMTNKPNFTPFSSVVCTFEELKYHRVKMMIRTIVDTMPKRNTSVDASLVAKSYPKYGAANIPITKEAT